MISLPREPFNYRLALLVLLTAGCVWVGFYSRDAKGQDTDYFVTMAIGIPLGVWLFALLVYAGHLFVSSYILRDANNKGVLEYDKVLPVVCVAVIGLSLFKIADGAKTETTKYVVQTPAGELVECTVTDYQPAPDDYGQGQ